MNTTSPHRIAAIGLGLRLARVLIAMKTVGWNFELVGYADPASTGAAYLEEEGIKVGEAFASPEALMAAGSYDLLMIGSPNHLHLQHLKLAVTGKSPIFCEKPIVRTVEETMEVARLLAADNPERPPVFIGLVLRSKPLVRSFVQRALSGEIGRLVSMDATEHLIPDHGAYIAQNWRRRSEWGGSFMLDKACHDFDIFNLIAGARPSRCASLGGRSIFLPGTDESKIAYDDGRRAYQIGRGGWSAAETPFTDDMDITDNQVAVLEYENGFRLSFHSNTHAGIAERRWFLVGTEGVLHADLTHNKLIVRKAMASGEAEVIDFGEIDPLTHNGADIAMARDLAAALEGGPFPVSPQESMAAGLTVMLIDRACASRDMVDCGPVWEDFDRACKPLAMA
jgi:predicted dehydrogenase